MRRSSGAAARREARAAGFAKEDEACAFLERNGYSVIERNFRTRSGELDVVARHGELLVFVEVRYRRAGSLVSAEESITREKARRIRSAVRSYLAARRIGENEPLRVDLCVVRDAPELSGESLFEIIAGIIEFA